MRLAPPLSDPVNGSLFVGARLHARMAAQHNIHPSSSLGAQVTIAATARIGPNCYLDGKICVGSRSLLTGGITLLGDATIGEDCTFEPGVCLTSSAHLTGQAPRLLKVGNRVVIGAGSVLAIGVSIGTGAHIAAGTVVVRNVPPNAFVAGNPALITGYATSSPVAERVTQNAGRSDSTTTATICSVAGVRLYHFPIIRDLRGDLSVGRFKTDVPFAPKRYFLVFDVPSAETRGEHAHRECEQFLICVSGRVAILVDDGTNREEFELISPNLGLYIPPRVWGVQYKYSSDAVLLVFASQDYDPDDYIRDYESFISQNKYNAE